MIVCSLPLKMSHFLASTPVSARLLRVYRVTYLASQRRKLHARLHPSAISEDQDKKRVMRVIRVDEAGYTSIKYSLYLCKRATDSVSLVGTDVPLYNTKEKKTSGAS